MDSNSIRFIQELQAEVSYTRKEILDSLELAFGDHPRWPYARSRVLRALGRSGLEAVLANLQKPSSPESDKEDFS